MHLNATVFDQTKPTKGEGGPSPSTQYGQLTGFRYVLSHFSSLIMRWI